jgi:glycosyltransferase involved in cell wall biosynthesis
VRVLHVTSTYPRAPGDRTGPFLADLVGVERDAGLDVRVVAPSGPGVVAMDGVARFRYGPARAEVLAYRGGLMSASSGARAVMVPPYVASMAATAAREARRWRADVVHAHWWLPGGLAAIPAGRAAHAPVVVTLHGSDVALAHRGYARPLARAVARRAAAVSAVSVALAEEASELLGVEVRVTAMPVMVAAAEQAEHAASAASAASDASVAPGGEARRGVVAVGRFAPEKGFDVLLDALRVAPVPLTLVGSGPLEAALRDQARGLEVRFTGDVGRPELHALLAGAAAVVVPSRREGLGLVAVEAILLGTPVIASHTGGLPEALGAFGSAAPSYGEVLEVPGGLLVPPAHVGALASALERAATLGPPAPLAVAGAARHRPDAVAAHHIALYESLLA